MWVCVELRIGQTVWFLVVYFMVQQCKHWTTILSAWTKFSDISILQAVNCIDGAGYKPIYISKVIFFLLEYWAMWKMVDGKKYMIKCAKSHKIVFVLKNTRWSNVFFFRHVQMYCSIESHVKVLLAWIEFDFVKLPPLMKLFLLWFVDSSFKIGFWLKHFKQINVRFYYKWKKSTES